MTKRISDLPNLGHVTERQLAEVGIADADDLRAVGALGAYARLKFRFPRAISLVALYALDGALIGTHWAKMPSPRKNMLRKQAAALLRPVRPIKAKRARGVSS